MAKNEAGVRSQHEGPEASCKTLVPLSMAFQGLYTQHAAVTIGAGQSSAAASTLPVLRAHLPSVSQEAA